VNACCTSAACSATSLWLYASWRACSARPTACRALAVMPPRASAAASCAWKAMKRAVSWNAWACDAEGARRSQWCAGA